MTDILIGMAIGAGGLVVLLGVGFILTKGKFFGSNQKITIHQTIQKMRSVGELVVFKVISRSIVTAEEHPLGEFGKSWLTIFISSKKMAIILEYELNFKYDLRDQSFTMTETAGRFKVVMPACQYAIHVRDIQLYDEQGSRMLPLLLGDIADLGTGFGVEEKNRLIKEARSQVEVQALELRTELQEEIRDSATRTLRSIARGFNVENLEVEFATEPAHPTPDRITMSEKMSEKPD